MKCQHPKSPSSFSKLFSSVRSQNPVALRSAGIFFRNVNQPFQDSAPFLSARSLLAGYKYDFSVQPCRFLNWGGDTAWKTTSQELCAPEGRCTVPARSARTVQEIVLAPAMGILQKLLLSGNFPQVGRS